MNLIGKELRYGGDDGGDNGEPGEEQGGYNLRLFGFDISGNNQEEEGGGGWNWL